MKSSKKPSARPKAAEPSTRRLTQTTGRFIRSTAGSRSLERGLALLRAFRPGISVLTNEELARRTSLPRPTVSRLTRSLVDAGFLLYDVPARGYRLGAVVLSLAQIFRYAARDVDAAVPLMRKVAEAERVNVGLAVPDGAEMVYLDSIRRERSRTHLPAPPGSRLPIEHTAAGRAYLAIVPDEQRAQHYARLAAQYGAKWPRLRTAIDGARTTHAQRGWCMAEWLPGLPVVATAMIGPDGSPRMLNIGFAAAPADRMALARHYAPILMSLAAEIRQTWQSLADPSLTGTEA
jgi:DNA-binding IclR family transcriptional regulator